MIVDRTPLGYLNRCYFGFEFSILLSRSALSCTWLAHPSLIDIEHWQRRVRSIAHVSVIECAPQTIVDHRLVTLRDPFATRFDRWKNVRSGHRFHPASNDVGVA